MIAMRLAVFVFAVAEILFVIAFFLLLRWSDRRAERARHERRQP